MNVTLHKASTRGTADHGWLLSRHSFSFADYHDPERMGFGLLRVLNDDIVKPAMGFGTHPHANMEIISIPLAGALRHQDSMGNKHVINSGEIQVMSAGSGLTHSEYNASSEQDVHFLQLWIYPQERDIAPRYAQQPFARSERCNRFQLLVSPDGQDGSLPINQQAWLSMLTLEAGQGIDYMQRKPENGVYFFNIAGNPVVDQQLLEPRDGFGVTGLSHHQLRANSQTELLVIEVPLH